MNNRLLGTIAILCAPFLCIDMFMNAGNGSHTYHHSSISGLFNFIYITGWMCSIFGLYNSYAAGRSKLAKTILSAQLVCLSLANCWNIYEILEPGADTPLYFVLDKFWPISNLLMLITGIAIIKADQLPGWRKFIPITVGLWLPIGVVIILLYGQTRQTMIFPAIYSACTWVLLGLAVATTRDKILWIKSRVETAKVVSTYNDNDY